MRLLRVYKDKDCDEMKTKSDWEIWCRGLSIAKRLNFEAHKFDSLAVTYANGYLKGFKNSKKSANRKLKSKNVVKQRGNVVGTCLPSDGAYK